MHILNKPCIFTSLGLGLVSLGVILAIFWMDIYRSILAKVKKSYNFQLILNYIIIK